MYNLNDSQKTLIRWLVQQVRDNNLTEEFNVSWFDGGFYILELKMRKDVPRITRVMLDDLAKNELLSCENSYWKTSCILTGKAYEAVDSNFDAPDTSFVKHLTPLANLTNLDQELKDRCLPVLSTGNKSENWDNAVLQAFRVLEGRLRSISGLSASEKNTSEDLVNKVFGENSSLITDKSKRSSYRNLYSGVFTVFRNQYSHRFVDTLPEDGGAIITFVNLLLKMLDDLRPPSSGSSS
jgi:uncharacterized protein (TIGR02391 family)